MLKQEAKKSGVRFNALTPENHALLITTHAFLRVTHALLKILSLSRFFSCTPHLTSCTPHQGSCIPQKYFTTASITANSLRSVVKPIESIRCIYYSPLFTLLGLYVAFTFGAVTFLSGFYDVMWKKSPTYSIIQKQVSTVYVCLVLMSNKFFFQTNFIVI